jgi:hypothetical protein
MTRTFVVCFLLAFAIEIWYNSYVRTERISLDDTYVFTSPHLTQHLNTSLQNHNGMEALLSQYFGIDSVEPLEQTRYNLRQLHQRKDILMLFQDHIRIGFDKYKYIQTVDMLFQHMDTDVTLYCNDTRDELARLFYVIGNIDQEDFYDTTPYITILRIYDDYFHIISIQFRFDERWEYSHFVGKFLVFGRTLYQEFTSKAAQL